MNNKYIESLQWRYATKKFDPTKKLSNEQIEDLKTAAQLSVSSFGLQPYQFLIIKSVEIKQKLKDFSYNQSQITDSSHLFVGCRFVTITEEHINQHILNIHQTTGTPLENLELFRKNMLAFNQNISDEKRNTWLGHQIYLVISNLISACAYMNIDSCPMEGFQSEKFDEVLDLQSKGLKSQLLLAVGYRSKDDILQFNKKTRKSKSNLFIEL